MASFSAATVRFQPLCKYSANNVSQGSLPSIVNLGWAKSRFPNLRTTRRCISCAAKPETINKVCEIVRKQLALSPTDEVNAETTFAKLGADSLDTVEIVMALEEEFEVSVEEENAQNITNIQEAAEVIDSLVGKKPA